MPITSISPPATSRSAATNVVTNVTMGKPVIVGPATLQAKALLAAVEKKVEQYNQTPLKRKLEMSGLHNLMGNVGAPKSRSAA